jgi:hypothetical protein
MPQTVPKYILDKMRAELAELDNQEVEIEGKYIKPSHCYHLGTDPAHVLFNTNCPEELRVKVNNILQKYIPSDEDRSQEERNDR